MEAEPFGSLGKSERWNILTSNGIRSKMTHLDTHNSQIEQKLGQFHSGLVELCGIDRFLVPIFERLKSELNSLGFMKPGGSSLEMMKSKANNSEMDEVKPISSKVIVSKVNYSKSNEAKRINLRRIIWENSCEKDEAKLNVPKVNNLATDEAGRISSEVNNSETLQSEMNNSGRTFSQTKCQSAHPGQRSILGWPKSFHCPSLVVFVSVYVCTLMFAPLPIRCQETIDYCSNATNRALCENGSTCRDLGYDFTCDCADNLEYTGWFCNVSRRQFCSPDNPCQNNGDCQETTDPDAGATYFNCSCPGGYQGPLCEKAIDYCEVNGLVCQNGGTCSSQTDSQSYTCDCTSTGYNGVNCTEVIDYCADVNCNTGQCVPDPESESHVCRCTEEWTGVTCETRVDLCTNVSYCARGVCKDNTCDCTNTGYIGTNCEIEENECNRTEPICRNGGSCEDLEGDFNCTCTLGYQGKMCSTPTCTADGIRLCNDGECRTNNTNWYCVCPTFYEGDRCETKGPCADDPCDRSNSVGNPCVQSIEFMNYTCTCLQGWEGQNCTEDVNECNSTDLNLCENGDCVNIPGGFTCDCKDGYSGQYCRTDIDECASGTECKNGGTCVDGVNQFTCLCRGTGYHGPTCSEDIDECENLTICNAGTCQNLNGSYSCECGERYLRPNCERENPCYNITCLNEGTCHQNDSRDGRLQWHCDCSDGFEGATCEKSLAVKDDDLDLAVILGPVIGGVILVIIIILLIAFVMSARSKRATRGAYSPSQQETSGSRVELGNVLKKPPEERLI